MNYFTPERWLRFQNVADARAVLAAHAEWERALADYRQELDRVRPRLPEDLLRFAERECLHDAVLLGDWQARSRRTGIRLNILVRPESSADPLVLLTYTLIEPPRVVRSALPEEYRTEQAVWMYDEIGVEEEGHRGKDAVNIVFTHAILLRDGREIALRFTQFTLARPEVGFPDAASLPVGTALALSHSA